MAASRIKTTIYIDAGIHDAAKQRAAANGQSVSAFVREAVKHEMAEDVADLQAFEERASEEVVPFEEIMEALKESGKL